MTGVPDSPEKLQAAHHEHEAGDEVDALLRAHFTRRLDGRLGTARRSFLDALEREAEHPAGEHENAAVVEIRGAPGSGLPDGRRPAWLSGWLGAGSLAAAALVLGVTLSLHTMDRPAVEPGILAGDGGGANRSLVTGHQRQPGLQHLNWDGGTEVWRDEVHQSRDAGLHILDGRPVRAIHQVTWERTGFIDPGGFEVEIEIPHETYYLIDAPLQ